MNKIDKDELFQHLSGFLKAKGIELQEGAYTQQIQKGCGILADTVNLSQQAFDRAKTEMERQLEHMRQIIHESTAPRTAPPPKASPSQAKAAQAKHAAGKKTSSKSKTASAKRRTTR
jgi:hypothetical protein